MAKTICVLDHEEIEQLRQNQKPLCSKHYHVSKLDANQMTGRGDFKPYFIPIAEWVGPQHIKMLSVKAIRGLSCKVGEHLAAALGRRKMWAKIMMAEIHGKRIYDRETREALFKLDVRRR